MSDQKRRIGVHVSPNGDVTGVGGAGAVSETFEHGGWRVTAEPHTGGRLQLWQRDDEGEWIDVGWNTTPDGLRDLIAAAAAALGDGVIVVDKGQLEAFADDVVGSYLGWPVTWQQPNTFPFEEAFKSAYERLAALIALTATEVKG